MNNVIRQTITVQGCDWEGMSIVTERITSELIPFSNEYCVPTMCVDDFIVELQDRFNMAVVDMFDRLSNGFK